MQDKITFNSGKAKEFFLKKISFTMGPSELSENIKNNIENINIIDVRHYDDYIDGHISYAIHVPLDSLEDHLVMLEKEKLNIVYSYNQYCNLGAKACYMLANKGFPVVLLMGGYYIWKKLGNDTVKTSS